MSGRHITLRQWSPGYDAVETPRNGEPFWDPLRRAFGVYNGPAEGILWSPKLGHNHFRLLQNQALTGAVADGTDHDIQLDWSVKDQLRIMQISTGTVLATFGLGGAIFAASSNSGSLKYGFQNYLVNPGVTRLRKNAPNTTLWPLGGGAPTSELIAPNWQAWMSAGVGNYQIFINNTDLPTAAGARNQITVNVGLVLAGAMALRTFVHHTDELQGQTCNASAWYKMPMGTQATMRVSNMLGVVGYQTITGSGQWTRFDFDFVMPYDQTYAYNNVLIFDVLYNPTSPGITYQVAGPQITLGSGLRDNELRSGEMDFALTRSIFYETRRLFNANVPTVINYEMSSDRWITVEGYPSTAGAPGVLNTISADAQAAIATWTDASLQNTSTVNVLLTVHRTPIFNG